MPEEKWISYFQLKEYGFVNPATGEPYSRENLRRMMRRGEWPAATQVSPNRVAWRLSELMRHDATRPRVRYLEGVAAE